MPSGTARYLANRRRLHFAWRYRGPAPAAAPELLRLLSVSRMALITLWGPPHCAVDEAWQHGRHSTTACYGFVTAAL